MNVVAVTMLQPATGHRHLSLHMTTQDAVYTVVHQLVSGGFRQPPALQVTISELVNTYEHEPAILLDHLARLDIGDSITIWVETVALPESHQYEPL